jgi:hypothetical protein
VTGYTKYFDPMSVSFSCIFEWTSERLILHVSRLCAPGVFIN